MPFEVIDTEIIDVKLIIPKVFFDDRGFFMESFKKSEFENFGIQSDFVQDNHSRSQKGVLRGLHFQYAPYEQGKLVRCTKGAILDVAVDIRKKSATFRKWVMYELSEENNFMLWIPPGFAHAFLVISENADVVYKVSHAEYAPHADGGIRWNDPDIGIIWPFEKFKIVKPLLSPKDAMLPYLRDIVDKL
ncbi:MAG: dTDP-4-dehydrorhamnose 3,5-epimerase [Spirochaetes bacterium]|nr:dTDP-4-dehydrorhamnose 3,5-epimerase [Spirochaetota bacterium]